MFRTTKRLYVTVSAGLVIGCCAGTAFAQGSLTPPTGTPGPSMKTLAQVEPRIPIMNVPYEITQPGSYYLTTNLVVPRSYSHGITILTNDVTVDLMGFSITGDRYFYGVWVYGKTNAPRHNIVVRNGTIKNFGTGLRLVNTQDSQFECLVVSDCESAGILLTGDSGGDCSGNRIAKCMSSGNGSHGITLFGSGAGKCDGNSISDCTFRKNSCSGVEIQAGSGQCNQNEFRNCMIQDNALHGIDDSTFSGGRHCGNVIESCNISGNATGYGIRLYGAGGSTVVGNRISLCTLCNNTDGGIAQELDVSSGLINGNLVSGTGGGSSRGIYVMGQLSNLIVQNTCIGQAENFKIEPSATYGPIVTASGALSTTNGAAGLSPWANFSR